MVQKNVPAAEDEDDSQTMQLVKKTNRVLYAFVDSIKYKRCYTRWSVWDQQRMAHQVETFSMSANRTSILIQSPLESNQDPRPLIVSL